MFCSSFLRRSHVVPIWVHILRKRKNSAHKVSKFKLLFYHLARKFQLLFYLFVTTVVHTPKHSYLCTKCISRLTSYSEEVAPVGSVLVLYDQQIGASKVLQLQVSTD
jgi:hypothetical protein